MVLRAAFGIVYFKEFDPESLSVPFLERSPESQPYLVERLFAVYEHKGIFGPLPPGGTLTQEESQLYENGDGQKQKEVLASALKREIGEELNESLEVRVDPSKMYMTKDSVTSIDGEITLSGELYFMRTEILPEDPLQIIKLSRERAAYLTEAQLREHARLGSFGAILSDPSIRKKLGL